MNEQQLMTFFGFGDDHVPLVKVAKIVECDELYDFLSNKINDLDDKYGSHYRTQLVDLLVRNQHPGTRTSTTRDSAKRFKLLKNLL